MILIMVLARQGAAFSYDREDAVFLVNRLALSARETESRIFGYNLAPGCLELMVDGAADTLVTNWLHAVGRRLSLKRGIDRPFTRVRRRFFSLDDPAVRDRALMFLSAGAGNGVMNSADHYRRLRKESFSTSNHPSARERQMLFSSHSKDLSGFPLNKEGLVFPPSFVDYSLQKALNKRYSRKVIEGYDRRDFLLRIEPSSKAGPLRIRSYIAGRLGRYPGMALSAILLEARSRFHADPQTLALASGADYEDVIALLLRA